MMHPLPNLGTGDLRSGGVFHQVINRHAARAAQPGFQVLNADVDIQPEAALGDVALWNREQIGRDNAPILAPDMNLVGSFHMGVEDLSGDWNEAGVRDPRAIVSRLYLAQLVETHLLERRLIGDGIILDGNLRGHSAHGMNPAAM